MQNAFPWYDSNWLTAYCRAKEFIQRHYPHKYAEFIDAFQPLRTDPNFNTLRLKTVFDTATLQHIKALIQTLQPSELEQHEFLRFGRFVVHDHPYFNQLQQDLTAFVSDRVGEAVEPNYNFLSLYNNLGTCGVHMDAPLAKWTLDICIEQSHPWPIHISQVQPWPEHFGNGSAETQSAETQHTQTQHAWAQRIKQNANHQFTAYTLQPGDGIIFSGSSQWHYRDRIPNQTEQNFCHLIFFHFIPAGLKPLLHPQTWATQFDIPELGSALVASSASVDQASVNAAQL
jgi:hypothetical protein